VPDFTHVYHCLCIGVLQVFLRWAQYGAFLPLMENGGGGEHRPWMYDEETTDIYRAFVQEHYRLIPYFMTTGSHSACFSSGIHCFH
jgi:alpha-glucosidase (family GH31 glycosyl hydrolase)